MRRARVLLATTIAAATWLGCNAILGIESATFDPDAVSEGGSDVIAPEDVADGRVDPDAGPCVDVATNPNHCGRCDHSCLGGACAGGTCQPVMLADDVGGAVWLAVDGTHVYWLNQVTANITRVPVGGGPKTIVHDGAEGTSGDRFLLEPDAIVFTISDGDGGVYRCPKAGCGATLEVLLPNIDTPGSIARNEAGEIFVAEFYNGGRILQCTQDCATVYLVDTDGFPSHVSASTNGVFWARITPIPGIRGKILDASSPAVALDDGPIFESVAEPSRVVWARRGEGPSVYTRDGGARRRLTLQPTESDHIAVDGDRAYYNDVTRGRVFSCPLTGCADGGTILADGQDLPEGIAFDDKAVYWVNRGGADAGAVMKIAK